MKKAEIALLLAFVLCAAAAVTGLPFARACDALRGDTFRLHIVANSDGDADQAVKLAVRDALLANSGALFGAADSAEEAAARAGSRLAAVEAVADSVLQARGFPYAAHARIVRMYFGTRSYGGITLPAGTYTALRVELGAAAGHNWWCVLYPSLCLPAAETDEAALAAYTDEERTVVLGGETYAVRFKLAEWFSELQRR